MSISPYPEKHQASSCEDPGNGGQRAENRVLATDVSAKLAPGSTSSSDERELLVNDRRKGIASLIATTVDEVASIHGFLIDLDCKLLAAEVVGEECTKNSSELFGKHVIHWIARDPVLVKAEVRATSKLGLHVLLYLDEPIFCAADQSRRWDKVVKCFRCILPGDPNVNGIIAMTRPVDAENTKYSPPHTVEMLREGGAVSSKEILDLAQRLANKPAPNLMQVLYGGRRITPCPLCRSEGSSLGVAGDWQVRCYKCGRTSAEELIYRFYQSYWVSSQKEASDDNHNS
jgi:hypothetical protein